MSLPARVPRAVLQDLTSVLAREAATGPIELIISSADTNVNLREFAAYRAVVDRVYGRLSSHDLQEYSRRPDRQLKVTQFRQGSLQTILTSALESGDAQYLLMLWLFLKYLPLGVREAVATYKDYEEGRYARAQRKKLERDSEESQIYKDRSELMGSERHSQLSQPVDSRGEGRHLERSKEQSGSPMTRAELRDLIRDDPELRNLPAERVRQLARLLDELYLVEERRIPAASRFARAHVLRIQLRIGTRERSD